AFIHVYIVILIHSAKVLLLDNHVSFGNIVFGLASARPTPQGLSGAPCLSINNVFNKVKNATRSKVTKPLAGSNLSRFEHNGVVYYGMTHLQYPAMKKEYVQNIARFIKQDMKF
ncbi:MAG: hypothetical protein SPG89_07595, partial [Prevotella sp.]|nr:hypothetical protein [Prevotella sp.]